MRGTNDPPTGQPRAARRSEVPYTPELREALLHIAEKIAAVYKGADPPYTTGRCHICGYAPHCLYKTQRL